MTVIILLRLPLVGQTDSPAPNLHSRWVLKIQLKISILTIKTENARCLWFVFNVRILCNLAQRFLL